MQGLKLNKVPSACKGISCAGQSRFAPALTAFILVAATACAAAAADESSPRPCSCGGYSHLAVLWQDARDTPAGHSAYEAAAQNLWYASHRQDVPDYVEVVDHPPHDAMIRRTDLGCDGDVDPEAHRLPDLGSYILGPWVPWEPHLDLFTGEYLGGGQFFRMDLTLDGFFNPPGPVDFIIDTSLPFYYGDHPVFGFVEINMDANLDTGGEFDFPEFRYLGNICRFGGLPSQRPAFGQRAARSAEDFDTYFGPVHRSGEEFHWALFGGLITQIDIVAGNGDEIFEPGEVWNLTGTFFHRAHAYEAFSLAGGGGAFGEYSPLSWMRFAHMPAEHATVVTLVFPLTNEGAALMESPDTEPEPLDGNPSNQASVLEALDDLVVSAQWLHDHPTGDPRQAIIDQWFNQNAADYLDPTAWQADVALATTYLMPADDALSQLVWTDMLPNVRPGDFNADGVVGGNDHLELQDFLAAEDGGLHDADGVANGVFAIMDFAMNFNIFDVNYDGQVDEADREAMATLGDIDLDGDVDLVDFATFAQCFGANIGAPPPGCSPNEACRSDLDGDGLVDLVDFATFALNYTG